MTDIPIIEAMIAFQPYDAPKDSRVRRGAVGVLRKDDACLSDYGMTWPATLSQMPEIQVADVLTLYRHLTAYFGVCATDVDEAFMAMPEYRAVILD